MENLDFKTLISTVIAMDKNEKLSQNLLGYPLQPPQQSVECVYVESPRDVLVPLDLHHGRQWPKNVNKQHL